MLKILLASSFYMPEVGGGAELTLHRLATGLVRQGVKVAVFTTGTEESIDDVDGVTVYRFPIDNGFRKLSRDLPGKPYRAVWQIRDLRSPLMARRFESVVDQFQPDIVQFHNLGGLTRSIWPIPRKRGIPSVQVLHDLYLICPATSMFKSGHSCRTRCLECRLFRARFPTASRDIDALVGISRFILGKITDEGLFDRSTHQVIYNAQSLPGPSSLLGGAHLRFGFIGALAPHKGVRWLIEQFDDRFGELLIAGSGSVSYVNELKALASGKRITFLGHTPSVQFFPMIDIGIVPSIWNEALGGVAIESQAHGRPTIITRRGGLTEIVRDGETGLIVDPDQPDSLGAAMARLAADPALVVRMAKAASTSVTTFTNIDRFLGEYRALYAQLLGHGQVDAPLQADAT